MLSASFCFVFIKCWSPFIKLLHDPILASDLISRETDQKKKKNASADVTTHGVQGCAGKRGLANRRGDPFPSSLRGLQPEPDKAASRPGQVGLGGPGGAAGIYFKGHGTPPQERGRGGIKGEDALSMLYLAANAPEALVTRSYYGAPRARGSPHPNLLGGDLDPLSSSAWGRDPPPLPSASTPLAMIMARPPTFYPQGRDLPGLPPSPRGQ